MGRKGGGERGKPIHSKGWLDTVDRHRAKVRDQPANSRSEEGTKPGIKINVKGGPVVRGLQQSVSLLLMPYGKLFLMNADHWYFWETHEDKGQGQSCLV